MGKKADKKKIRKIEIQIHKGDFKNLRDIAEMIGYDSVEEYIEDAIVRVATADYNMITMLAEDHLTRPKKPKTKRLKRTKKTTKTRKRPAKRKPNPKKRKSSKPKPPRKLRR